MVPILANRKRRRLRKPEKTPEQIEADRKCNIIGCTIVSVIFVFLILLVTGAFRQN